MVELPAEDECKGCGRAGPARAGAAGLSAQWMEKAFAQVWRCDMHTAVYEKRARLQANMQSDG